MQARPAQGRRVFRGLTGMVKRGAIRAETNGAMVQQGSLG